MIPLALVVAGVTLGAAALGAVAVRRLPTLGLQIAGLAALAVLLPLGAVVASALLMFDSEHDLTILAVTAAASSAAGAAMLGLGRRIGRDVEPLRQAAARLAAGDLSARAPAASTRELRALSHDFNEMATRVEDLFGAHVQLVAWASHDLRTPLANMQAMLEALEDGLAEPAEYLGPLRDQVRALGLLVDDLFELARIDAGVLTLELRDAELVSIVDGCVTALAAEAKARRVELRSDVPPGLTVRCAPEQVARILFNLLTNALRHTPTDGTVAVRADAADSEVRVLVEDTGAGLQHEREPSRDSRSGGLGLAIARGLAEAQGGRVWAENRNGGGACVSFTLPAAEAAATV